MENHSEYASLKEYICEITSGKLSKQSILKLIKEYSKKLKDDESQVAQEVYGDEIIRLNSLLEDADIMSGNHPLGIDEILVSVLHVRSIVYAIESSEKFSYLYESNELIQQWFVGMIYFMVSGYAKLLSNHKDDTSLRKLWKKSSKLITKYGAVSSKESNFIDDLFSKNGRFTNENSSIMRFRNKTIAHNEMSLSFDWKDFDDEVFILVRVWSLLVSWASAGKLNPFIQEPQLFTGLGSVFTDNEIEYIMSRRNDYIQKVIDACKTRLHNGTIDDGRIGFTNHLKVQISMK